MKYLRLFLLSSLLTALLLAANISRAVTAYPYPFQFRQPDGSFVTIMLKGDEKVHWAETTDGYTLLNNGKDGWEYAVQNEAGDIVCSGTLAKEVQNRTSGETALLLQTPKQLKFSKKQVLTLLAYWNNSKSSNENDTFDPNGTKKLIMILIGYTDLAFTKTQADFNSLMNQVGYNLNGAVGSVKDYFLEQSYGKFNIQTTVVGPYTAAHDMAYYGAPNTQTGGHDIRAGELMTEAVTLADPDVNFADYDNDGDGVTDGVYIVYAGYGEASGASVNTIWPHAGGIGLTLDGTFISSYSCSNELQGTSGNAMTTIGVICHEFGHVCGSPDYYDTDYETDGQYDGTGNWDLMAGGSWGGTPGGNCPPHMAPIEKVKNGWITPIQLVCDASVSIPGITTNPVLYRYNTTTANEYYLIENRQKTGFNASVPGHGLMIYHVDENYIATAGNKINCTSHQGMFPMSAVATNANGVHLSADYKINVSGCPWPGTSNKTTFSDATTPNALSWAGNATSSAITNISETSGTISFCFKTCPAVNPAFNLTAVSPNGNEIDLNWLLNSSNNDVILAYNTSSTFGDPVNGNSYNSGDAIPGGGTVIYNGGAGAFTKNGLAASTTYYFKIWSVNGSVVYSAGTTVSASTLCASVPSLPYNEGFESGSIPGCWTQEILNGNAPWEVKTTGTNGYPSAAHSGTYLMRCRVLISNAGYVSRLISPPVNISSAPSPVLKFWHTQANWSGGQDILRVYYRTSGVDTWKQLAIYTNDTPAWTLETLALPEPSANYFIAFEATANAGYGVCVDDVEIQPTDCTAGTWLGTVSTDWFSVANWCGSVPGVTTDVVIPSGTPYSPVIGASGAVCRNLTINNGATLAMNAATAYTFSVKGNWTNNGTFSAGLGTVDFNATNDLQTINGTSTTTFNILKVTKGALSRILEVNSLIALSGSTNPLSISSGTFKLSSNSTISPFTSAPAIWSNCGFWNNGGTVTTGVYWQLDGLFRNTAGTTTFNSSLIYNGSANSIMIDGGNVNFNMRLYNFAGAVVNYNQSGGTVTVNSASTSVPFDITTGSTFVMSGGSIVFQKAAASGATYDLRNLATNSTITGGTLQAGNSSTSGSPTIRIYSVIPVYDLVLNATGTPKLQLTANGLTVKNNITIGTGTTLIANNLSLSAGGNWINNGTFTPGTGTVTFNGTSVQNITGSASTTFKGLTLNNPAGVSLSGSVSTSVDGVLTLTSGVISTGANKLIITSNGSVSRTSGHIAGNLQKNIATGTAVNRVFEIGDASEDSYSPVSVTFASVSVAGNLTASTSQNDHPFIGLSSLNDTKSINRYWTLTNSGTIFTSYDAVFNFLAADKDATTNIANLSCGKYAASAWTYPVMGSGTATSSQVISATTFGDFQLAENYSKSSVAAGGNWSNPSTWSPSGVPVASDNVRITSPATVNVDVSNAVCDDLTIASGSKIEVNPGMALTVNGSLANNGGATALVLKSDPSGTGVLLNSTSGVQATVERYLTKYNVQSDFMFHFLSSPVASQAVVPEFQTAGSTNTDFYGWSENTNTWINSLLSSGWNPEMEGDFQVGKGYLVAYPENLTKTFKGTLNTGDVSTALSYTPSGSSGWNLAGNPYSSAIDWDLVAPSQYSNIDNAVYVWDNANQNYKTWVGNVGNLTDGIIPAMQGFFVKANASGPSLTLKNSNQVINNSAYYKGSTSVDNLIHLKVEGNSHYDDLFVRFDENATAGFDGNMDAYKLEGGTTVPEIYTTGPEYKLAVNSLPFTSQAEPVAVNMKAGTDGAFTLKMISNTTPVSELIFLTDLQTGEKHLLNNNPEYSFHASATDDPARFQLIFKNISDFQDENNGLTILSLDGTITILSNVSESGNINIIDMAGRLIKSASLKSAGATMINMEGHPGVYVVNVNTTVSNVNRKVVVR